MKHYISWRNYEQAKRKKAEKLKKLTIAPYIWGLIFANLIFFIMGIVFLSFMISVVVVNNLTSCYERAVNFTEQFKVIAQSNDTDRIGDFCNIIIAVESDTKELCITNSSDELKFMTGFSAPPKRNTGFKLSIETTWRALQ